MSHHIIQVLGPQALEMQAEVLLWFAAGHDVLWIPIVEVGDEPDAIARAQSEAAQLQRSAAERALRAYRAGESGLTELLAVRRALADAMLAERLARSEALETGSRLRLDLHEMWDFDD